jgi:hypothetical protein
MDAQASRQTILSARWSAMAATVLALAMTTGPVRADGPTRSTRSMAVAVDLGNGLVLNATLDDQNFDAPDYDGSVVLEGSITGPDDVSVQLTISATADMIAQQAAAWQNIYGDSFVLSVNADANASSLHEVQSTNTGAAVTTQLLVEAAAGSVTISGDFSDLAEALGSQGASPNQLAVIVANLLSTTVVGSAEQASPLGPSLIDCLSAAQDACGECNHYGASRVSCGHQMTVPVPLSACRLQSVAGRIDQRLCGHGSPPPARPDTLGTRYSLPVARSRSRKSDIATG